MNGVQTRFKCKLDVKRCKRFVFPPSSLLPRSNALKTKAIRYFQTDRTLTRIVSPPLQNTPAGNVWLIFCLYSLSADQRPEQGIYATITQMERGEVETLSLSEEHRNILSEREKEILRCIRKGLSSKEIAATLYISVNTVNRHRQNILEKLSVGNSIEACRAAELMKLL